VGRAFGVSYVCFAVRHHRAGIAIMPIEFNCTQCGKQLRTPDETAGRNAKCPQCGAIMQIPDLSGPAPQQPPAFGPSPGQQTGASPFGGPPPQTDQGGWNPYASPNIGGQSAAPGPSAAAAGVLPSPVYFSQVMDVGWRIYKTKIGFGALMVLILGLLALVMFGIFAALGFATFAAGAFPAMPGQGGGQGVAPQLGLEVLGMTLVLGLIGMVFQTFLEIGVLRCFLDICRGGAGQLGDLFSGGKWLGRGIIVAGIFFAVDVAASVPGHITENEGINLVASIVGTIVKIAMLLLFGQALPLIVDKDMDIGTALTTSMQIMNGNKAVAVGVYLVTSICAVIFTAVTCGIGAFFAGPLAMTIRTVFYMHAAGQPTMLDQPAGSYQ
jgi:hypothetical protein